MGWMGHYGAAVGYLWGTVGCLWGSYGAATGRYGAAMGLLWSAVGYLWGSYGVAMGHCGVSMGQLWGTVGYLWGSHGALWGVYGAAMGRRASRPPRRYSVAAETLTVSNVDYGDEGTIQCRASTPLDSAEAEAQLRVVGEEPPRDPPITPHSPTEPRTAP